MGGVKNNINKLNRNSGGPQEGLRWDVGGGRAGDLGSQHHSAFSHQGGELCKKKDNTVTACDGVCHASAADNTSCPISSLALTAILLFFMVPNLR